jgi:hypothetical protein
MNWKKGKTVNVKIKILYPDKNEIARNEYKNIHLDGGRTFRPLKTFKPEGIKKGHYFVIYEIK